MIRGIPLFSKLPVSEIDTIAASLVEKTFPARSILIREGERGDQFYIVAEGQIAIIKALDTPDEVVLNVQGPGELIGEMSLFSQDGLRTASVRAETDVCVLEMTRSTFESLLSRQPTLMYEMLLLLGRRLIEANDHAVRSLTEKNEQLVQANADLKAAQDQIIENEIIDRELCQARDLQRNMLPEILPRFTGYDLGARMIPAHMVGGDFYDVIPLDADRLGLAVGDVAGKGVPAAMFMSLACSLLRSEAHLHASPTEVLELLNQHLLMMNPKGLFVTVLYGVFHLLTGEFVYARAGHERPLVWKKDGALLVRQEGLGQPLGLFKKPALDTQTISLPPGSMLLLYTDGITEAQNAQSDFFGEECLQQLVPDLLGCPAQELCDQLVELLSRFYGGRSHSDDLTLLALKALS